MTSKNLSEKDGQIKLTRAKKILSPKAVEARANRLRKENAQSEDDETTDSITESQLEKVDEARANQLRKENAQPEDDETTGSTTESQLEKVDDCSLDSNVAVEDDLQLPGQPIISIDQETDKRADEILPDCGPHVPEKTPEENEVNWLYKTTNRRTL